MIIGITGGIGSGKSVVSELFRIYGVSVYDADSQSKHITESSPVIREKLTTLFGSSLYEGGRLDKKLLASHIFQDPHKLSQVNAIIHPQVKIHFDSWVEKQENDVCAIESAILFESGFYHYVNQCLMVYAPLDLRIARCMRRDNSSYDDVSHRIRSQMPDEEKRDRSNHVIVNDEIHPIIPQVYSFLSKTDSGFSGGV